MSTDPKAPTWLARLAFPTEYVELRALYTSMAADPAARQEPRRYVAWLEEAARLIGRESVRDQGDLEDFERAYADFREKEDGVVGWLRRHLPFTETRRKEKEHRAQLDDQQAELRSNLFVLARLRLCREAALPEGSRVLGAPADVWSTRLHAPARASELAVLADAALELEGLLAPAYAFLDDVRTDIDAFDDVSFSDEAVRGQQLADIEAARAELGTCLAELERKQALLDGARDTLRAGIAADLRATSGPWREVEERLENLAAAKTSAAVLGEELKAVQAAIEEARGHAERVGALADRPVSFAHDVTRIEHERNGARRAFADAERDLEATRGLAKGGEREVEDARERVRTLEAELRAASAAGGLAEADPRAGFDDGALRSAEAALHAAEQHAAAVRRPHEEARAEHIAAQRALARLEQDLSALEAQEERREREYDEVRDALRRSDRDLRARLERLEDTLAPYLQANRRMMRLSDLPGLAARLLPASGVDPAARDPLRVWSDARARAEALLGRAAAEREELERELQLAADEQGELFSKRAQALLGSERMQLLEKR